MDFSFTASQKYVIDSDFIFGFLNPSDANHQKAQRMFAQFDFNHLGVCCSNLVKEESATLFSKKYGHHSIPGLIDFLNEFNFYFIDEKMTEQVWQTFLSFQKKNISFVDCSNLILADLLKADILSFDRFYGSKLIAE